MKKNDLKTAQHFCGVVARFFEGIEECVPEYDGFELLDPREGDFLLLARDFVRSPRELETAREWDRRVVMMARAILGKAE